MAHGYSAQQGLIPMVVNLAAAVAAGTNETWALGNVPAAIPTMHLLHATLQNGANVTANATDYNTFEVRKGSTVMATLNCGATDLVADTPVLFTRSTTVANRKATAADALSLVKTATGNGTAGATSIQAVLTLWFQIGSEDLGDS